MIKNLNIWKSISSIIRQVLPFTEAFRISNIVSERSLFQPTTGRWLWNEPHQIYLHSRLFDVTALEDIISRALGEKFRKGKIRIQKLAEGASNKVFRATGYNQRVIVKIPDPLVPARYVLASEVATIEYLRTELDIPIPKVIAWSMTDNNPVGCEYIIMEEASGVDLNQKWPILEIDKKFAVIDHLVSLQRRILQHTAKINGYGSLYFTEDAISLGLSKQLPISARAAGRFCLGRSTKYHFLDSTGSLDDANCGPWLSPQDYFTAIANSSIATIQSRQKTFTDYQMSKAPFSFPVDLCSDVSPTAALNLLKRCRLIMQHLIPKSQESFDSSQPALWHGDLHLGNIFISPTGNISSIIDWQETTLEPLILKAKLPRFLEVNSGHIRLELPDGFSSMLEPSKSIIWNEFCQSMLQQYYFGSLRTTLPEIAHVFDNDPLLALRQLAATLAGGLFDQQVDILLLRELMMRVDRNFASHGKDPINAAVMSSDELNLHRIDGRKWNEFKDLLVDREIPVAEEGWVPRDDFKTQKGKLRVLLSDIRATLHNDKERQQFQENITRWKITD